MSNNNVTIVTAFFDIGRSDWSNTNGSPDYLDRSTEKYFQYFENLAQLDNPIIVYTSADNVEKIRQIRVGKQTQIVEVDFQEKFQVCRDQIQNILDNEYFRNKINPDQLKNPEYWSADYVLVNNLKSYFVKKAIWDLNLESEYIAWVDFGYCRDSNVLNGMTNWVVSLNKKKVHLFTISNEFKLNEENVYYSILNNQPYIIGGVIVATKEKWFNFADLVKLSQKKLINELIIDDDQGVYLLSLLTQPKLFKLNYLGKNKWFDVFKKYDSRSKISIYDVLKKIVGRY